MIQITMGLLKENSESCDIYQELIDRFNLELDKSKVYDVGVDQSTSCTGLAICPIDNSFKIIIEVLNVGFDYYYTVQLRNFIEKILSNVSIRYFIMEEPLNYISGKRNKTLSELKKYLGELKDTLCIEHFDTIMPASWRHGLMPKVIEGDRRKKATVVRTLIEMYPGFNSLLPYSNDDFDGMESLGILEGYRRRHGLEDSSAIKILGPKNTRKSAISFFKYCDVSSGDFDIILANAMKIPKEISANNVKVKTYNGEVNIYTNSKMSLTDPYTFTIVSDELDIISSLIRMGEVPKANHMLFMFVVHAKLCSDLVIRSLYQDGYFPVLFQ